MSWEGFKEPLRAKDIRIDTYRDSIKTQVRLTHLPTGIVVEEFGPAGADEDEMRTRLCSRLLDKMTEKE